MSTLLVAFALLDAILLVGVLLIYLNWVAGLLEKIDNGLATTVDLVVQIVGHAEPIVPGLQQINRTLGIISGALPLLYRLAERIDASPIDAQVQLLTSQRRLPTPFATAFAVEQAAPFHPKLLRDFLRQRHVGCVTIIKRGSPADADDLLRKLKLDGPNRRTLVLTRAVGAAAKRMIEEVRRQFREQPKIMAENPADRVDPDYARCVDISTRGALRAMVLPGIVAVLTPIAVGTILGPQAEAGMLMVGTMGGIVVATFLNNGGGAWDNAKKYIEAGYLRVNAAGEMVDRLDTTATVLGKTSEPHKASVVGDTVGDPFKDTAGPSLHVVIKLLSTITLVLAPLFIALHP